MNSPLIISLCDHSGNVVEPWAKAGYECWTIDLKHSEATGGGLHENIRKIGCDILEWELPKDRRIAFMFAFPPCTHLAVSGSKWFKGKGLGLLADSIRLVGRCAEICEESQAPYLIENPVGTLSTYWRKPDYLFDPFEFAGYLDDPMEDAYTKKTCLWVGNGFIMPEQNPIFPWMGSKMHAMAPMKDRAEFRSVTPRGFSKAIFEANHKRIAIPSSWVARI